MMMGAQEGMYGGTGAELKVELMFGGAVAELKVAREGMFGGACVTFSCERELEFRDTEGAVFNVELIGTFGIIDEVISC